MNFINHLCLLLQALNLQRQKYTKKRPEESENDIVKIPSIRFCVFNDFILKIF